MAPTSQTSLTVRPRFLPLVLLLAGLGLLVWAVVLVVRGGEAQSLYPVQETTGTVQRTFEVGVDVRCQALLADTDRGDEATVQADEEEAGQVIAELEIAPCNRVRQQRATWGLLTLLLGACSLVGAVAARRSRTRQVELAHGETLPGL